MARFVEETKKERSIIFIHVGSSYPCVKHGWFTDDEWKRMIFARFDLNERDYYQVNDSVILVMIEKGN